MRFFIRHKTSMVLGLILLFGMMLRAIQFGSIPVSLYWDEMAIWNDAQSIIHTGRDLHDRSWFQPLFISYGDYKLPVYIWSVALSSLVTKDLFLATRLPSLFAGGITIISAYFIAYWLGKNTHLPEQKSQVFGMISSAVVAVMPWSLHFSRVGYEGHLSLAFVCLSVWLLLSSFNQESRWRQFFFAVSASLLGSIAIYTYFSTRFVWPVIFVLAVILWEHQWRRWGAYVFGLVLWCLLLIPMYRADFYQASNQFRLSTSNVLNDEQRPHRMNFWREKSGNTLLSRVLYNSTTDTALAVVRNGLKHLDPEYLFISGEKNLRHGTGFSGILFWWMAPFLVIGVVSVWRSSWKIGIFLGFWWAVSLLPASIPLDVPHALRSLNALPAVALFVGLGIAQTLAWFSAWTFPQKRAVKAFSLMVGTVIVMFSLIGYFKYLTGPYKVISSPEWQDGYLQAAQYIAAQRQTGRYDYIYVKDFDERFFLYYQPYSDMTWQEIQKLPSKDFQRTTFNRVRLKAVDDWDTLEDNSLVISRRAEVPEDWSIFNVITNTNGEESFVSVETTRNR